MTGHLHVLIGPVGAGKSTFAAELCRRRSAVLLNLDDWMEDLFGADVRPEVGRVEWYLERRDRCLARIRALTQDLLSIGTSVVAEVGLLTRPERSDYYAAHAPAALTVYVLDAPREVRWDRVAARNEARASTRGQVVPRPFFEMASDLWEPPDQAERASLDIRDVEDITEPGGPRRWLWKQ